MIKKFFIIVLKNAVNAVLTNSALMAMMHGSFNMYSRDGWWNLGKATLAVIGARELVVWLPPALNWSKTDADPDQLNATLKNAAVAVATAGNAIADAQSQATKPAPTPTPLAERKFQAIPPWPEAPKTKSALGGISVPPAKP